MKGRNSRQLFGNHCANLYTKKNPSCYLKKLKYMSKISNVCANIKRLLTTACPRRKYRWEWYSLWERTQTVPMANSWIKSFGNKELIVNMQFVFLFNAVITWLVLRKVPLTKSSSKVANQNADFALVH